MLNLPLTPSQAAFCMHVVAHKQWWGLPIVSAQDADLLRTLFAAVQQLCTHPIVTQPLTAPVLFSSLAGTLT